MLPKHLIKEVYCCQHISCTDVKETVKQYWIHCLKSFTETGQIGIIHEQGRIHCIKQIKQLIPNKIHESQLKIHKQNINNTCLCGTIQVC